MYIITLMDSIDLRCENITMLKAIVVSMGSTNYMDNGQLLLYENLVFSVFSYVHRKATF